jgi:hypothetical protein
MRRYYTKAPGSAARLEAVMELAAAATLSVRARVFGLGLRGRRLARSRVAALKLVGSGLLRHGGRSREAYHDENQRNPIHADVPTHMRRRLEPAGLPSRFPRRSPSA